MDSYYLRLVLTTALLMLLVAAAPAPPVSYTLRVDGMEGSLQTTSSAKLDVWSTAGLSYSDTTFTEPVSDSAGSESLVVSAVGYVHRLIF